MPANNVWKMTAKDKDGNPVEASSGLFTFMLRGPESLAIVKQHGQQLLNAMRQRIFDNTGTDPGYKIDDIQPAGHSDQTVEAVGDWRPVGAQPINMPLPVERDGE